MDVISNVQVYGLEESIKRAKYPMSVDISTLNYELTKGIKALGNSKKGEGHDNFLNGIVVQFDLTFTVKAWTEEERYHFIDFISSQSTMHRITKFDLDEAYIEYVDPRVIQIMKEKVAEYNRTAAEWDNGLTPQSVEAQQAHIEEMNRLYLGILYTNPCGFKLTAGMTTNYRQLKTIYSQRKNHRLPEWKEFCAWVETLPMFKELCLGGEANG
jgi:hypothetical protein